MKRKVIFISLSVFFLLLLLAAALTTYFEQTLQSHWSEETQAAEYVLNHSPIEKIETSTMFTASGLENVFTGKDIFGQSWIVFYFPDQQKLHAVLAKNIINTTQIETICRKFSLQPSQLSLGWLNQEHAANMNTNPGPVWEVYGKKQGENTYYYFNAANGDLICQYVLQHHTL
ncbi:hypothetical protein ACOJUR_09415 [Alicyclobacillus tolerans]|uniref:hypothetical protein n=1 Tax=Alicyclobacillus tolerans TaxID=90970 RepID=UPI003B7B2A06